MYRHEIDIALNRFHIIIMMRCSVLFVLDALTVLYGFLKSDIYVINLKKSLIVLNLYQFAV